MDLKENCLRRSTDMQPVVGADSVEENDLFMVPPQRTPKYLHPAPPCAVLPAFPCGHPHLAALQAVLATLLPFCDPWVSTSVLATASAAVPRPPRCQAPVHPHCPNASATQINLFQLFCAVSVTVSQSLSPHPEGLLSWRWAGLSQPREAKGFRH